MSLFVETSKISTLSIPIISIDNTFYCFNAGCYAAAVAVFMFCLKRITLIFKGRDVH